MASGWGGITNEINRALEEKRRKEEEERRAEEVRQQFLAAQQKELERRQADQARRDAENERLREEARARNALEAQRRAQAEAEQRRTQQQQQPPTLRSFGEPDLGPPVGFSRPSVDTGPADISSSQVISPTVRSDRRTPSVSPLEPTYGPPTREQAAPSYQRRTSFEQYPTLGIPNRNLYEPAARAPEPPRDRQAIRDEVYRTGQPQGPSWLEQGAQWLGEQTQRGADWLGQQPLGQRAAAGLDYLQDRYGENPQPGVVQEWWQNTPGYRYAQELTEQRRRDAGMPGIASSMRVAGAAVNEMGDVVPGARAAGATMGAIGTLFNELGQTEWGQEVQQRGSDILDRVLDVPGVIMSDTRIPGLDMSLTEIGQPIGQEINQTLNPFNLDVSRGPIAPVATALGLVFNPHGWAQGLVDEAKPEFDRVRQAVDEAAKSNPDAVLALRNLVNGPQAVEQTLNLIMNKDQMVQQELEKARTAEANGNATLAARHLAEAERLRKLTPAEMVQENMNPWAEVVRGVLADPTSLVTPFMPLIMEGAKVRKAATLFDITPDEALRRLEPLTNPKRYQEAVRMGSGQAQQVWNTYVAPYQGTGDFIRKYTWFWERPASSKAELDANAVFTATTSILHGFTNKEDVRTILGTLAQQPTRLVEGLTNLTGTKGQPVQWGPGLVANEELIKRFPIIQAVADRIPSLPMLQGNGPMSADEIIAFQAALGELYYDASKRFNGAFTPLLPLASAKVDLVRQTDGTAILRYLDKAGKSIYDTAPMPYQEAQTALRQVKADTQAGILRTAGKVAYFPFWLTKAVLSDVWLGFRPANWIGNATGATVQLFANDSYTTLPRGQIIDHLARQLGGYLPTPRVFTAETGQELSQFSAGAVAETTSGFLAWLGSLGGKYPNSPLARLSRAAYNIPYGNLEIPLGKNLSIPISEQNFALRAFYVPQQRVFRGLVDDSLATTLQPVLQGLNLDPATTKLVLDKIYSLATEGGRTDIVQGLRTWLGKPTFVPSLKSLGVAPETITPGAAARIEQLLSDALPEDAPVILREIRKILDGERKPVTQLLNTSGVHPGIRDWTDVDLTHEVAWLTKQLTDIPKNIDIGIDPAQLRQQAQQLSEQVVQARRGSLDRFFTDLPAAENNPNLWSLTMDFWTEVFNTKTAARQVVDDSSRRALQAGTPEAWADKWRITQETYTKLAQDLPEISDKYRLLLDQVSSGQPYTRQYDWWDALQKRLGFDEEEFRTLRAAGLQGLDLDQGQALIDANRQYIDNGFWDLFSAFQRYPSIDNFDIVRNTMNTVDAMGARTAAQVADLRTQLANGLISKKQYAKRTGELWTGYFDATYHYLGEMTRATIAQGIAPQTATDLRWFDADGTEWRLIGPSNKKGKYLARNPETNRVEEFTRGASPDEGGPFVVPSYVVDDLENMAKGKPGEAVERIAQQIADSRPAQIVRDVASRIAEGEIVPPEIVQEFKDAFKLSPQQAQGVKRVLEARAKVWSDMAGWDDPAMYFRDMLLGARRKPQYEVNEVFKFSSAEASADLDDNWRIIVTAYDSLDNWVNKNPTSPEALKIALHELGHVFHADLIGLANDGNPIAQNLLETPYQWAKKADDRTAQWYLDWTARQGEDFADGFVRYLQQKDSKLPAPLRDLYERFKVFLNNLMLRMGKGDNNYFIRQPLNKEMRQFYDGLLGGADVRAFADDTPRNLRLQPGGRQTTQLVGPPERVNGYVNGGKAPDNFYELLGIEKGTPLKGTLQEWVQKSRQANGQAHTHIGDVAQFQVNTIDNLERTLTNNIDSILQGTPNQLSGGQILRIIDGVNDWLPQWDDALGQSIYVGDQMVGWTMLNFADKRNIDSVLQLLFPFPYFWSRMGPRVALNGLQKPGFVNFMYEMERGIDLENQQSNVPQRLEGTLPVGTNQRGDQYRLGVSNISKYLMPNYWQTNWFVDEEAPGASVLRWTPSLGPAQQMIYDGATAMAKGTPMPDYQFSDLVPIPGIGVPYTSIPQLMTGTMQPQREGVAGYFANPDEWDPYRARRAVGYIAVEEGLDQAVVAYANQVIRNQYEGRPVGEGIPPERLEAAMALAQRGVQRGAQERTQNRVTGYMGLMPLYTYPKAEQDMRQAQGEYYAADYDPMTQQGSKGLQRQYLEENPALKSWWTKGFDDPGASGRRTDMNSELDAMRAERQAEIDAAIQRNPNVDDDAIYDINEKYKPIEKAIRDKYDVPDLPPSTDPLRGMNPREQATYRLERILNYQPPGKPERPPDGASDAEMRVYYAKKGEWDEKRLQWVESQLAMLSGAEQPYSDMDAEARELLSGQYTTDLLRREQNRYTSDVEYDYWERNALEKEAEAVEWQAREEAVKAVLGERGLKAYQTYMNADDETRAKLREQDSIYTEAREVAFNTDQYQQAAELFGPDWFKVYANAPRYPGDNPSDEELQAFYDELSQYKADNPQYNEIDMWMDGRPLSDTVREGLVQNNGYLPKNYGEDWQQAKQWFGDDIFQIVQGREEAYAKSDEAGKQFYRNLNDDQSRRLAAYDSWRKELREQDAWAGYNPPANAEEAQRQGYPYPQDQGQNLDWRTYQGPRPLGSDAEPVVPGEAQSPPGWVRGLGAQPPAQGPQTPGMADGTPPAQGQRPIPTSGWGGLNDILAGGQAQPAQTPAVDPLANVPVTDGSGFPTLAQAAARTQPQTAGGVQPPSTGDPSKIGEYAAQNQTYQDVQAARQQWESRKAGVYTTFGEDVGGLYEQYIALPKGQARADFKAQHPELRAVSLYTWNPDQYQYLADTYGADAVLLWARTPAWADSDEARKRRNDYYDKYPVAFEINAWLYGRPGDTEADITDDETFSYNFGADYGTAKELFGDNIWSVVAGYKRGWSKEQKSAYFDANPKLGDFFDWWYGNLPDTQRTTNSRYYGGYGGRSYGGGGWSWGGGGGGFDENAEYNMDAYIAPTPVRRADYRIGDMQGYRRTVGDRGWQRFMQMFGDGRDWRRTYR